jgi:hypothetical protein
VAGKRKKLSGFEICGSRPVWKKFQETDIARKTMVELSAAVSVLSVALGALAVADPPAFRPKLPVASYGFMVITRRASRRRLTRLSASGFSIVRVALWGHSVIRQQVRFCIFWL